MPIYADFCNLVGRIEMSISEQAGVTIFTSFHCHNNYIFQAVSIESFYKILKDTI
jgi:hypothetical protein